MTEKIPDNRIGIRLKPGIRDALQKAADDDDRSLSAMGQKIIADWLRSKKYLKP